MGRNHIGSARPLGPATPATPTASLSLSALYECPLHVPLAGDTGDTFAVGAFIDTAGREAREAFDALRLRLGPRAEQAFGDVGRLLHALDISGGIDGSLSSGVRLAPDATGRLSVFVDRERSMSDRSLHVALARAAAAAVLHRHEPASGQPLGQMAHLRVDALALRLLHAMRFVPPTPTPRAGLVVPCGGPFPCSLRAHGRGFAAPLFLSGGVGARSIRSILVSGSTPTPTLSASYTQRRPGSGRPIDRAIDGLPAEARALLGVSVWEVAAAMGLRLVVGSDGRRARRSSAGGRGAADAGAIHAELDLEGARIVLPFDAHTPEAAVAAARALALFVLAERGEAFDLEHAHALATLFGREGRRPSLQELAGIDAGDEHQDAPPSAKAA